MYWYMQFILLVSSEDQLRFLHHFPDSDRSVVGTGSDRSLSLQTVNGRHPILVAKPGGGEKEGGEERKEGGKRK